MIAELREKIEDLSKLQSSDYPEDATITFLEFRELLGQGKIRAAEYSDGAWSVNSWVKKGILLGFSLGKLVD